MKNADMPSKPCTRIESFSLAKDLPQNKNQNKYTAEVSYSGLTKREEFAARFMAAHLTSDFSVGFSSEEIAKWAIEDADTLLKALEESK